MTAYVGVDWASRGWLAVTVENGAWTAAMHPSMHSVWFENRDAERILVDIPIGLPDGDRRACDRAAKEFLGPERADSVFWTPCRAAVDADTYERAKRENERCRGDSLSAQAWGLVPRIREVDRLLRDDPAAAAAIRESHPEVCFAAFAGGEPLPSKHDEAGRRERVDRLTATEPSLRGEYERLVDEHVESVPTWARRIGASNRDDLLDAMALALAAARGADGLATLPEDPPEDGERLPMEIVYAPET